MKFNENLAAIHAYLCADGYAIKNPKTQKHKYYRIGFRNINLILLRDFQKRFKKYFKIKPRLVRGQRCEIGSREIYENLTEKFGSFYSREWRMPKLNKEFSRAWLRTFFDCEGWVTCKTHQNRHIGADCVNEKGILQIKQALIRLGISPWIKKRLDREIFSLKIYGKENLVKFSKDIGFLHPLKKEKLKQAINDFVNYYWSFPKGNLEKKNFLKKIMLEKVKVKRDNGVIRIISNKEVNLLNLQKELNNIFNIESKVNKRINGIGTIYFQLNINKKEELKKIVKNKLLSEKEKEKWLKSKK